MGQSAIIGKLKKLLTRGITSEAEAAYFMVEVRKLLEQQNAQQQFEYLTFHCDWAVHAKLNRSATVKRILKLFDDAHAHFKAGIRIDELPGEMRLDIECISKMAYFEQQLEDFLLANGLPLLSSVRADGWTHFLHLYCQIVEECPLVMTGDTSAIESVTLQLDLAEKVNYDEVFFRVTWVIAGREHTRSDLFVTHSFSVPPQTDPPSQSDANGAEKTL
jgi:hypothetical protein